ncbi:LOW QUALITY PROTEIN: integrin alpha-PS3 [Drosophila busckii]|uniref:LOW QUALITY PROTEIN: integrin alpha-PS3 n=1 Tax=Drosophila busckii TaxID=30019 RepID=UPI0014328E42|nr:LOW QUALITY PROTEIN: integrin alpha-PS3 [Drosophila busckii]
MAGQGRLSVPQICSCLLLIGLACNSIVAYNLSPRPNRIIRDPQLATVMPKVRASYFGYTMSLRPHGIFVGAPQAQSTLEAQRKVNETGAVYKCSLLSGTCNPYIFEGRGNINIERSEYTWDSERRDYQWLGGAMDGGTKDTDKLLVCAPRFIAPSSKDYHMNGICYWVADTLADQPQNITKISPLRLKDNQVREDNNHRYYFYILAEQGLSAHIADDNDQMLIGAPGIFNWRGSVIRQRKVIAVEDPSASRRDTSSQQRRRKVRAGGDHINYEQEYSYETSIPNPGRWKQPDDSYFGYAVSSGYFDSQDRKRLLYVATAPQANEQSGEGYIFDIQGKDNIDKLHVFRGEQFGEYFGYSVLAEDLNGDNLTDLIISAPQHSFEDSHDNGAIYVFINKGRFNFESKLLRSPLPNVAKARFGTTLTRLGDINHDGFNDIAVGAPFAGNGSVFIYLGSELGLRNQPSQRLDSPLQQASKYGEHMFGHGLSRGSDIDANGFNDFAVGAPNAEALFIYRAYPVVKLLASVRSQSREIKPDQNRVQITACYGLTTTSKASSAQQQDMAMRIVIDAQLKRAKFVSTQSNELSFNAVAGMTQQCRVVEVEVRYSEKDIFQPIELEMHYELTKKVPDSEEFCETCVAVDPADPKVYSEKIIFSTGCATDICIADLQLSGKDMSPSYILGSSKTLRMTYEVTNQGETAYLPQLNVTSSSRLNFAQTPGTCNVFEAVMVCDLNRGRPLMKGDKDSVTISFDVSALTGSALTINAEVFSTGQERNPLDNKLISLIALQQYTEIDASGGQTNGAIDLEHYKNSAEIINNYEIKSNGPSTVDALELVFHIPVAYKIAGSTATIPIINVSNLTMQATYDAQLVAIELLDQNNTQLILNPIEVPTSRIGYDEEHAVLTQNGEHYDISTSGHVHEHLQILDTDSVATASMSRKRRDLKALTANREQYARISNIKAHELLSDDLKGKLPVNRTIVFNCKDPEMTICLRAIMRIYNFKPEKPVNLNMRFSVDLNEVNAILSDPWEFFAILIDLNVRKEGDPKGSTLAITRKIEPNVISKHLVTSFPIWIIIVSVLGGLLLLAAITYGMYKAGFFNRAKKEELDKLVQQSPVEPEAETLNSGDN